MPTHCAFASIDCAKAQAVQGSIAVETVSYARSKCLAPRACRCCAIVASVDHMDCKVVQMVRLAPMSSSATITRAKYRRRVHTNCRLVIGFESRRPVVEAGERISRQEQLAGAPVLLLQAVAASCIQVVSLR